MKILTYIVTTGNFYTSITEQLFFTTLDEANEAFDELSQELDDGTLDGFVSYPVSLVIDTDLFQEVDIEIEEFSEETPLQDTSSSL